MHVVLCFLQVRFYFHCLAYWPPASLCFMLQYELDLPCSFQDATSSAGCRAGAPLFSCFTFQAPPFEMNTADTVITL